MERQAHERSPRPGRARTAWLVGGLVLALLLWGVLWEGKPSENASSALPGTKWKIESVRGVPAEPTYSGMLPFLTFDVNDKVYGTVYGLDTCGGTFQGTGYKTQAPSTRWTQAPTPGQTVPDSSRMAVERPS